MDILFPNLPQDNTPKKKRTVGRPPKNGKYAIYKDQHTKSYQDTHKDDHSRWGKIYRRKLKIKVLAHYSGSEIPFCACCREDHLEFLTIDHIHGDGAEHRKTMANRGRNTMYRWLIQNGYPDGFRVLCYNCNCAMGFYGYCPHEKIHEKQLLLFEL